MIKISLLLLLTCLSTLAQTGRGIQTIFVGAPAGAPKSATMYIAKKSNTTNSRTLLPRGEAIKTLLPRVRLSATTKIPSGDVVAWILDEAPTDEGIPAGAQKIEFPAAWTKIGLIFTSDPENRVFPAKVIPVNLGAKDFKLGDIMIYNLSKAEMVAELGSTKLNVKSNSFEIISAPKARDGYKARIGYILPGSKERKSAVTTTWVAYNNFKEIKFMIDDPNTKNPRIWGVRVKR